MHAAPPFDQSPIPYVGGPRRAYVYAVHDGDTLWVQADVGFGLAFSNPEKGVRLVGPNAKGFNTPELNAPDPAVVAAAKAARDRVTTLVLNQYVYVESWPPTQDDKYGRWLMAVYISVTAANVLVSDCARIVDISPGPGTHILCFDLASQLVAENLGVWQVFG